MNELDDFCLGMDVVVDESCGQLAFLSKRPGPALRRSDSEPIRMAVAGECRGLDIEPEMWSEWRAHRDLLPRAPSQSRFSRQPVAELVWFSIVLFLMGRQSFLFR